MKPIFHIAKRADWQKARGGETFEEAVIREVQEELGVELRDPEFFKKCTITTPLGPLNINTFTGEISDNIILKTDELIDYDGWFATDELEA